MNLAKYIKVFSELDWQELDNIIHKIQRFSPHIIQQPIPTENKGDPLNLGIVPLMVRSKKGAEPVNKPYITKFLAILKRAQFLPIIQRDTKIQDLKILRMQLYLMGSDSHVNLHTDQDSDPAYLMTAIIKTQSEFTGGEMIVYGKQTKIISQQKRFVYLLDSALKYEIKPIFSGFRNSLIVVLGKH